MAAPFYEGQELLGGYLFCPSNGVLATVWTCLDSVFSCHNTATTASCHTGTSLHSQNRAAKGALLSFSVRCAVRGRLACAPTVNTWPYHSPNDAGENDLDHGSRSVESHHHQGRQPGRHHHLAAAAAAAATVHPCHFTVLLEAFLNCRQKIFETECGRGKNAALPCLPRGFFLASIIQSETSPGRPISKKK